MRPVLSRLLFCAALVSLAGAASEALARGGGGGGRGGFVSVARSGPRVTGLRPLGFGPGGQLAGFGRFGRFDRRGQDGYGRFGRGRGGRDRYGDGYGFGFGFGGIGFGGYGYGGGGATYGGPVYGGGLPVAVGIPAPPVAPPAIYVIGAGGGRPASVRRLGGGG